MKDRYFLLDLSRCTGCGACAIACKDRADAPDEVDLVRIDTDETGSFPNVNVSFRVTHCFHCEAPPCVGVCDVKALEQTEEGWVRLDAEACVRCGACIEACPFTAIVASAAGVPFKCDGCPDEVAAGRSPVCVRACPMRALHVADGDDAVPGGHVVDVMSDGGGAKPRVRCLRRSGSVQDTNDPG